MSGNFYCDYDLLNAIGRERLDNDSVILCLFFKICARIFEWRPGFGYCAGLMK